MIVLLTLFFSSLFLSLYAEDDFTFAGEHLTYIGIVCWAIASFPFDDQFTETAAGFFQHFFLFDVAVEESA